MTTPLSRRGVLAGGALASTATVAAPAFAARPGRRVAVLGGGMAGLTAAHELAERGFKVTVYEPAAWGGKARSIPVAGTGRGGRRDLPGEHGFRFFPGFYHHVPDTMRRIPFGRGTRGRPPGPPRRTASSCAPASGPTGSSSGSARTRSSC